MKLGPIEAARCVLSYGKARDSFRYPCKGPGRLWEECTKKIRALGGKVELDRAVTRRAYDAKTKKWTVTTAKGEPVVADHLISSAPAPKMGRVDFSAERDHSAPQWRPELEQGHLPDPVVVTGGAGFLGDEVVRQLKARACRDIRIVDVAPFTGVASPEVRPFRQDIRNSDLSAAFEGAKTVLHLAACQYHTPLAKSTYDLPFFEVNGDGTRRVIEASRRAGVERLVFVSTNMVYGLPQTLPIREDHQRDPFGPYGQSKLQAEHLIESAHEQGLDAAIIRPGLIVGPGRTGVVARVFDWILANRPIWLIGSGRNRYEMMACEDVASLVVHAGAARGFGIYNCAARSVPTMREWIDAVIALAGSRSRVIGIPGGPLKLGLRALEAAHISPLRRDQYLIADLDYYMDASRARDALGWSPRWAGLDAILETFRWYTTAGAGASSGAASKARNELRSREQT